MVNAFDRLGKQAFGVTTRIMGYTCQWNAVSALVHFRNPSKEETIADAEYKPEHFIMEYYDEDLPGLFSATQGSTAPEIVINGISYIVVSTTKHYDGLTIIARLEKA